MLSSASGNKKMDNFFMGVFAALSIATAGASLPCIVDTYPALDKVMAAPKDTLEATKAWANLNANLAGGVGGLLFAGLLAAQASKLAPSNAPSPVRRLSASTPKND